jgi:hypothetical protein
VDRNEIDGEIAGCCAIVGAFLSAVFSSVSIGCFAGGNPDSVGPAYGFGTMAAFGILFTLVSLVCFFISLKQ